MELEEKSPSVAEDGGAVCEEANAWRRFDALGPGSKRIGVGWRGSTQHHEICTGFVNRQIVFIADQITRIKRIEGGTFDKLHPIVVNIRIIRPNEN